VAEESEVPSQKAAHAPLIVAIAGPKGGVGRSTVALELARALARREQRVLIIDLVPHSQTIAWLLEMPIAQPATPQQLAVAAVLPQPTSIDRVSYAVLDDRNLGEGENTAQIIDALRKQDVDWVLLDLPAGFEEATCDLFVRADVPLLLATPEGSALSCAAQMLRACVRHVLRRPPDELSNPGRERWCFADTPHAKEVLEKVEAAPMRWHFVSLFRALSTDQARSVLVRACEALRVFLLLNQCRETSESVQGESLCHAWALELGIRVRPLGGVCHEERRWFFVRRLAPGMNLPREESIAGDLDHLARTLLQSDRATLFEELPCLALVDPAEQPRAFLTLAPGQELRPVYRRLWEGYRRENGLIATVVDPAVRKHALALLDAAYRKASLDDGTSSMQLPAVGVAITPAPFPATATAAAAKVKEARESKGLSLRELSLRTRIGVKHLEAIESGRVEDLTPAYLRAYANDLAKFLDLDGKEIGEALVLAHSSRKS